VSRTSRGRRPSPTRQAFLGMGTVSQIEHRHGARRRGWDPLWSPHPASPCRRTRTWVARKARPSRSAFVPRAVASLAADLVPAWTTTRRLALPRSRSCFARAKHERAERSTTRSVLVPCGRDGLCRVDARVPGESSSGQGRAGIGSTGRRRGQMHGRAARAGSGSPISEGDGRPQRDCTRAPSPVAPIVA